MKFSVIKTGGRVCLTTKTPDGREIKKQPVIVNGKVVGWIKSVWVDGKLASWDRIGKVSKTDENRWLTSEVDKMFSNK